MERLLVGDTAPDFALPNHLGQDYRLSQEIADPNVLQVLNLGFI